MPFMLLIMEPPEQRTTRSLTEGQALYERMTRFAADLKARGVLLGTESLKSSKEGARVEVRGGRAKVIDGPFAEAKEMVGGFFLLDCTTREEAIAIAAECPAAQWASVEVRAVAPCYDDAR